jgi:hypothetical protein
MSTIANVEREAFLKWVEEHRAELQAQPWFESVEQLIESNHLNAAHELAKKNALRIYGESRSLDTASNSEPSSARDKFRQLLERR